MVVTCVALNGYRVIMMAIRVAFLLIGSISYINAQLTPVIYTVNGNTINATAWPRFDCRRPPGVACYGNGVCSDGTCTCNAAFSGIDCGVNIDNGGGPVTCNIPCDSVHGTCLRNNKGVEVCDCEPGFTGPRCDIVRASVLCRDDDMFITLYPQRSSNQFEGRYGAQHPGTSAISVDNACSGNTGQSSWVDDERFETALPRVARSNQCISYMTSNVFNGTGGIRVCYDIRLQYNQDRVLFTDEVFKFCCEDSTIVGARVNVDNNATRSGANIAGVFRIISSRLQYTKTKDVLSPGDRVNLGDELSFVMFIDRFVTRYNDFRVVQCYANPGNIRIVSESCPDLNEKSVIKGIRHEGSEIHVDIFAYRGTFSNVVFLECDCRVCTAANPCPVETVCPNSLNQTNLGRKKRQVEDGTTDNSDELFTASVTFIVTGPDTAYGTTPPVIVSNQTPCYQSAIFIAIVTVFGVLLLIALVVSVFLCMRYAARDHRSNSQPKAYLN